MVKLIQLHWTTRTLSRHVCATSRLVLEPEARKVQPQFNVSPPLNLESNSSKRATPQTSREYINIKGAHH